MDSLFAIRGKDCVVMVADSSAARSIVRMKKNEDKITVVDGNKLMGAVGAIGDSKQFTDYIKANVQLASIRQGRLLPVTSFANFARSELAYALRRGPHLTNLLIAGPVEKEDDLPEGQVAALYWIDYLGSMVPLEKAAHGYGAYFVLSVMDRYCKADMTKEETIAVARKCCEELKTRFLLTQCEFFMKIVTTEGVEVHSIDISESGEQQLRQIQPAPTTTAVAAT